MKPKPPLQLLAFISFSFLFSSVQGTEILLSQGVVTEKQILPNDTTYSLTENIIIQDIHSFDDLGGGVFFTVSSNLIFQGNDLYNLKISNCASNGLGRHLSYQNEYSEGEGVIFGDNITFRNMGEIDFIDCSSINEKQDSNRLGRLGAAITSRKSLTFRNIKKITATGNHTGGTQVSQAYGGAFFSRKAMVFDYVENLHFSENYTDATFWTGSGYSLHNYGGALFSEGMDSEGNGCLPIGEYAISFTNIAGSVTFTDNRADGSYQGYGGAIYAGGGGFMGIKSGGGIIFSEIKGDIFFSGNIAASLGGVDVVFQNTGNVLFQDNSAMNDGGAIYLPYGQNHIFSADNGNITFRGNTEKRGGTRIYLNSILFNSGTTVTDIRAQKGRETTFFDPFNGGGKNTVFHYNRTEGLDTEPYGFTPDFSGVIRFSGVLADQLITRDFESGETEKEWLTRLNESKYTNITGQSNLHGGTFILEHGVTYGNRDLSKNASFTHRAGFLQMTAGSTLNAKNVSFSGRNAILRTDNTSSLTADHIDMSQGFSFDFLPFLDEHN